MATLVSINPKKKTAAVVVRKPPAPVLKTASPQILRGAYGPYLGTAVSMTTRPKSAVAAAAPMSPGERALMQMVNAYKSSLLTRPETVTAAKKSVADQIAEAVAGIKATSQADIDAYNQQAARA